MTVASRMGDLEKEWSSCFQNFKKMLMLTLLCRGEDSAGRGVCRAAGTGGHPSQDKVTPDHPRDLTALRLPSRVTKSTLTYICLKRPYSVWWNETNLSASYRFRHNSHKHSRIWIYHESTKTMLGSVLDRLIWNSLATGCIILPDYAFLNSFLLSVGYSVWDTESVLWIGV